MPTRSVWRGSLMSVDVLRSLFADEAELQVSFDLGTVALLRVAVATAAGEADEDGFARRDEGASLGRHWLSAGACDRGGGGSLSSFASPGRGSNAFREQREGGRGRALVLEVDI